jgi:hypothetical protein
MALYDSCAIRTQKLFVSLFFLLKVAKGATLQAPHSFVDAEGELIHLYCKEPTCPPKVIQTSQDCSIDPKSPFTLQICRIEELVIEGVIMGAVVHIQRTKMVTVDKGGQLTASEQGCRGGQGMGAGQAGEEGVGGGAGHGGMGGTGIFNKSTALGGGVYGDTRLPCALGSGGGVSRTGEGGAGGGVIVLGGKAHPLQTLELRGFIGVDGQSSENSPQAISAGGGGGSGGTILMFLNSFQGEAGSIISSSGGAGGAIGGGGGAGGRVHFEWANIKVGDAYVRKANSSGVLRSM